MLIAIVIVVQGIIHSLPLSFLTGTLDWYHQLHKITASDSKALATIAMKCNYHFCVGSHLGHITLARVLSGFKNIKGTKMFFSDCKTLL